MSDFPQFRIGQGFDVHAYGAGDHVVLGGVRISHDHGLIAHSDGDVVVHALCDALLGSLALGDIGIHFPPTDSRWRSADSMEFLVHCHQLLREQDWRLCNADITVICESPKIAPHALSMRERLARVLHMSTDGISVKATTCEKLGFIGRDQGIAAQAVCLIARA